jgi:hypothetical protein
LLIALAIGIACASGAAEADPAASGPVADLSLAAFLTEIEDRLIDVQRVELRQTESVEKINHLNRSRALELEVEGTYQEQRFDRLEINGSRRKDGQLREYERDLRFSISHPLLGRSLEDRMMIALEHQRLIELEFEEDLAGQRATIRAVDLYLELLEVQEAETLLERGIQLENTRVRILRARQEEGEVLERDVLGAESDRADRALKLARTRRRRAGLYAEIEQQVAGSAPAPFHAVPLDWEELKAEVQALPAGSPAGSAPPIPEGGGISDSIWYNVPRIDLTVAYEIHSLDRTFADEVRRERGGEPRVQLSLEMPLDFYRSARAFKRQVEARHERRRLNMLTLQRRWRAARDDITLAVAEADAALAAAEAKTALQREDLRITRLRVTAGEIDDTEPAEVAVIRSELDALDAAIELGRARSELAHSLFERELTAGRDPRSLALALAPQAGARLASIGQRHQADATTESRPR